MKKIALFLMLAIAAASFTGCVHRSKKCKQNAKKIHKMRKNNPNFKV